MVMNFHSSREENPCRMLFCRGRPVQIPMAEHAVTWKRQDISVEGDGDSQRRPVIIVASGLV